MPDKENPNEQYCELVDAELPLDHPYFSFLSEVQYDQANLYLNLEEIRNNKKPFGYIKEGAKNRLLFPMDRKEMIIYRGLLSENIRDLTEEVAKILRNAKIKFTIEYDKMLLQEIRARRK